MRPYTSVDLFCGAGGLSEGFRQAGFQALFATDIDQFALETFAKNHPQTPLIRSGPIEELRPRSVLRSLSLCKGELDVLIGGPPCQGFSINAPDRAFDDPRNHLFRFYIDFVSTLMPKFVVIENVPGLVSMGDWAFLRAISDALREIQYEVEAKILYAAHYGVPQERWRLVIIGSRITAPTFPLPTHFAPGRPNFRGGRTMTFRNALRADADGLGLEHFTTVADAISDLPSLKAGEGAEEMPFGRTGKLSDYARDLRIGSEAVFNHIAPRIAKVNLERLRHIPPGGSWRDIPFKLLPRGMQRARRSDHTRRYGRLHPDGLAGTIMTKCDPHWGPVFLPTQERTLSVREAARLQSFPDRYRFYGPRVAQYAQVGNAVPPLLARAVAREIATALSRFNRNGSYATSNGQTKSVRDKPRRQRSATRVGPGS